MTLHHLLQRPVLATSAAACLLLPILGGCASPRDRPTAAELADVAYASVPSRALTGRIVYQDSSLRGAWKLWRFGDRLFLGPGTSDSLVAVISIRDFVRRGFVAGVGYGPGEYRDLAAIAPLPDGDGYLLMDAFARRLRVRPADGLLGGGGRERLLGMPRNAYTAVAVTETTVATLSVSDSGRIVFCDTAGRAIGRGGRVPGSSEVSAPVRQMAYQSTLLLSRTHRRFVVLQRHGGGIEFYALDGSPAGVAHTPFEFAPPLISRRRGKGMGFAPGIRLRFGYIGGAIDDRAFYALFSGHTIGGGVDTPNAAEYVHVFDWSGALMEVLALGVKANAIALSADGRTLYAAVDDPVPGILAFDLRIVPSP